MGWIAFLKADSMHKNFYEGLMRDVEDVLRDFKKLVMTVFNSIEKMLKSSCLGNQ